ncbi:MAG: alpha/beta fold hydrolase [Ferruginibacter sp.]|nr:alpha/beta fold hydrolase [Ferruginibacter sp.]
MTTKRQKIFRWIKIILLVYGSVGIALYYLQEKFLFHPEKLASDHVFEFDGKFMEFNIPVNKEDTISLVKFFPEDSIRKGIVLYFHGNMKNIERYAEYVKPFTKNGYEVWMEDYPGFGKSTGKLTEKKLYDQALQVQKMAAAIIGTDSIILYGKSLGTGIAAYVASVTEAKMLLLETPYYSIPHLFGTYAMIYPTASMSTYKIPTYEFVEDVKEPIVIFAGTGDWVVPYRCAKKLSEHLKSGDLFITIEDSSHNNVNHAPRYYRAIDSLLN